MSFRRIRKKTLWKNATKPKQSLFSGGIASSKIALDELPFTTVKVTIRMLRAIFILIFLYIATSIFVLIIQGGDDQIRNIMVYSISGFFTFFMGYFGWMFARMVMEIVSGKKPQEDDF